MYRRKQMLMKWKDKKDILMASTIHNKTKQVTKIKGGEMVEKPQVVLEYNAKMGGVDLADNYLHSYTCAKNRMRKYYMKNFRHFLDITCLNCFQIYKNLGGKNKDLIFF